MSAVSCMVPSELLSGVSQTLMIFTVMNLHYLWEIYQFICLIPIIVIILSWVILDASC